MQPFDVSIEQACDAQVVYLSGELDYAASLLIGPRLDEVIRDGSGVILFDLREVSLIDSECIKMTITAFRLAREYERTPLLVVLFVAYLL